MAPTTAPRPELPEHLRADLLRAQVWAQLYGPMPADVDPCSRPWYRLGPSAWLETTRRTARELMRDRLAELRETPTPTNPR